MSEPRELPATLGFRKFAELQGWRPSYVTELKGRGHLVLTEDGRQVRVPESLQLLADLRDPAKIGVAARHAAARAEAAPPAGTDDPADADADPGYPTDVVTDSHARRRAKALADKAETDAKAAERDYRLSMGELLEAADVEQTVRSAATTFRGALENLPNTLAPELSSLADEGRVRVVLAEAFEHVLEELSRVFAKIGRAEGA
ncbi:MAG: hypothetical protein GX856_07570 [Gammaproteobacteria bacterium]|nr:hypothetical protein [Gammaproteobacteria bacterium]